MALSAFAAFVAKLQSLDGVPDVYTFDAPPSVDNAQVYPSYIVVSDDGTVPEYDFEHNVVPEVTEITVLVYCDTLDEVDAAVEIVKYNGGGTTAGLGMDFGTLPDLTIPYTRLAVVRQNERRFAAKATGKEAQRIHGCEMKYQVTLFRS